MSLRISKTAIEWEENPYKEDSKTIEEKRLPEADKHIVEIAHPEPVYTAESDGKGGLVENQIEQQEALIGIVNKMPTGQLVGRHASMINRLIALADKCDIEGETEAADLITETVKSILDETVPFLKAPTE